MAVNGNLYDWESVEVQLPQGVAVGIDEISYEDERDLVGRYGKGSIPRGRGRKNYSASGSLTLDLDEYEKLRVAMGGSVYAKNPVVIVVSYANHDQETVTDTLGEVEFTKQSNSAKQGEDNVAQKSLDFKCWTPIQWNGVSAYNDGRDGAPGN